MLVERADIPYVLLNHLVIRISRMALAEHRFQKNINLAAVSLMSQLMIRLKAMTVKHPHGLPVSRSSGVVVRNELLTDFYSTISATALRPVQELVTLNQDQTPATIQEVPELVIETFIALLEKQRSQWLEKPLTSPCYQMADNLPYIVSEIREIGDQIKQATADLPFGYGR
jgi:hypothetical protein